MENDVTGTPATDQTEGSESLQNGAKGAPDAAQKQRRESYEQQIKTLQEELNGYKEREATLSESLKKALTEEDVNAAVKAAQEEAKAASEKAAADFAAREKALTVTNALLAAGCSDTIALMAHINLDEVEVAKDGHISGLDTKKLSETYPYLFQQPNSNTQTLSSASNPGGSGKKWTKKDIMAIKDASERRRLIAQNIDLFNA